MKRHTSKLLICPIVFLIPILVPPDAFADVSTVRRAYAYGMRDYYGAKTDAERLEALKHFERAAAEGHLRSIHELGRAFHYGFELPADISQAVHWYEVGVNLGDPASYTALGDIYSNAHRNSEEYLDLNKAISHYATALDLGCSLAPIALGNVYRHGVGVAKDPYQALEYYKVAIERGAEAVGHLLIFFLYDWGELPDPEMKKAMHHLYEAAAHGSGRASRYIADSYKRGYWQKFESEERHVFPVDSAKAEEWYRYAFRRAPGGDTAVALAEAILEGPGGSLRDLEAARLLQVAEGSPVLRADSRVSLERLQTDKAVQLEQTKQRYLRGRSSEDPIHRKP